MQVSYALHRKIKDFWNVLQLEREYFCNVIGNFTKVLKPIPCQDQKKVNMTEHAEIIAAWIMSCKNSNIQSIYNLYTNDN